MVQVSKINIVLPYEETQQKLHIWACEEKKLISDEIILRLPDAR